MASLIPIDARPMWEEWENGLAAKPNQAQPIEEVVPDLGAMAAKKELAVSLKIEGGQI